MRYLMVITKLKTINFQSFIINLIVLTNIVNF